ncbi:hypothetical protein [Stenotrophomonas sp. 364]|uniref:hypothetical protein n=1 Tax=Stenotrophomonas sp. 364 TaxID=2691571 RepID=UPI001317BBC4|nr:hypothetical protein [Stenotrophomonas sp. 364]QHB73508.1 hypothetical protein GQ674_20440 [Stenotrophomonas sp. 364]
MGKQSDAKRKAKLKERQRRAEAAAARSSGVNSNVAAFFKAYDSEPNVIAELLDQSGGALAHVEGSADGENWTIVVMGEAMAGTHDEFLALGLLLGMAIDDRAAEGESFIQFSPWLVEQIEESCDARGADPDQFLRSLLPMDKRDAALPPVRIL